MSISVAMTASFRDTVDYDKLYIEAVSVAFRS